MNIPLTPHLAAGNLATARQGRLVVLLVGAFAHFVIQGTLDVLYLVPAPPAQSLAGAAGPRPSCGVQADSSGLRSRRGMGPRDLPRIMWPGSLGQDIVRREDGTTEGQHDY